jgi:hypothetical protein
MASTSVPSRRGNLTLAISSALLFGVAGFFAGRFSVPPADSRVRPGATDDSVSSAANRRASTGAAASPVPNETGAGLTLKTPAGWDEKQWQQLVSQPGSPARNAALAAMLEQLAAADPDRAMKMAQGEGNLKLREDLVQASLHGWARTSPTNAANWALALSDSNARERALSTVFAGAVAANPDAAVQLGKQLFQQNPTEAAGYGSSLITALCEAGHFETAIKMAGDGDPATRSGWMAGAWSKWAEFQPDQAAAAAAAITDPELRDQALHGIIGGWAEADPAALVQFMTQLPPDGEKNSMISQALQRWAKVDPQAASEWMNGADTGPELDEGVAAVASMDSLKPDVAIGWAESVIDPKLRSETLVTVLRNWVTVDLPAAENYFNTTKDLLPEDRQELAGVIATLKGQSTAQ